MNLFVPAAGDPRGLPWVLLALAAAALAFRLLRPQERRSLRAGWLLIALALGAHVAANVAAGVAAQAAGAASLVLAGLAVIQLGATLLFRGLLPALHLAAPRIAQDLTVTAASLAWCLVWLRLSGVDPSQLFTTSALITAVVAFSMQDTLGNVLGGVALQLDNSLRVGDWVRVDDVSGRVSDVRWRYTAIETRARELVVVPNSWLMKNRFTVIRAPADGPLAWRRAVSFNIDPEADPATVCAALERAVLDGQIPHVLTVPLPSAILSELAAGYCRYTLRYWLADPQFDDPGDSAVRVHALAALARAGVRQGVPVEERLTIKENDSWRAAAGRREFERRLQAIRGTELFAQLSGDEQAHLAGHLVHAPFAAGDIMTRQGAVAHWLYLIIQGEAQVSVAGPQGSVVIGALRAGDVFGEMGMLTGEPRGATVVAQTAVECYRLDKDGFAQLLRERPEIAHEVAAIAERRNAERGARMAQAGAPAPARGDLLARVLSFFSLAA
ncbi:mechanosensitive ion channel family protein [Ramlibacter sp. AN1133]|uniref:mechanosensitive ion channel family protein n=1 Tax=Ramlibacter sp. AN1133 TaxID=3133429 RepID=UPI0030C5CEF3